MSALRVGTRGSALALAQTTALAARFAGEVEIVEITTQGDVDRAPLAQIGGTGVFTSALREALLADEVDVIVHSMKDLPTAPHPGIALAAVARREDARDALCARDGLGFDDLPEGAKVGTGSPRRAAQLRRVRPDLDVVDIRGNVETRLARAQGPGADLDAVVLALAGLTRLGRQDAVTEVLSLGRFPTAPAQGALAVETRDGDAASIRAVAKADHVVTRACADAERLVLAGLEAGCSAPIAASAEVDDGMLFLTATVYAIDGSRHLTASHAYTLDGQGTAELAEAAMDVAGRAVRELVDAGAMELDPGMTRVLIPRGGSWGERVSSLVADAGLEPLVLPLIQIAAAQDQDALRAQLDDLGAGRFDWLVVTSQSTVRYLPRVPAAVSVAAVGNVTAAALRERGIPVAFVPRTQSAAGLVDEWPIPSGRVLWPRSEDAKPTIEAGLRAKGMDVVDVVAYRTVSVLDADEHELDDLGVLAGDDQALTAFEPRETPIDAVLVTSGSVAKQVLRLGFPDGTTVVAIGEQTAEDCRRAGLHVSAIATTPTPEGLVAALVAALPSRF